MNKYAKTKQLIIAISYTLLSLCILMIFVDKYVCCWQENEPIVSWIDKNGTKRTAILTLSKDYKYAILSNCNSQMVNGEHICTNIVFDYVVDQDNSSQTEFNYRLKLFENRLDSKKFRKDIENK